MQIWPAIDLRGGRCVRLEQGDYGRETVFSDDPAETARRLVAEGAAFLHLVDLDGAREGRPANLSSVQAIVGAVKVPCELGGGIRDEATIRQVLELGVARVVIGTKALKDPDWFRNMARRFVGQLALGIDARDGMVATEGWLDTSTTPAVDLARQFNGEPVAALIYTDIARDGMLGGPNLAAMQTMVRSVQLPVIASGGVTSPQDVAALAAIPMVGCIIGRALYEGKITIAEALAAAKQPALTQ